MSVNVTATLEPFVSGIVRRYQPPHASTMSALRPSVFGSDSKRQFAFTVVHDASGWYHTVIGCFDSRSGAFNVSTPSLTAMTEPEAT